MGKTSILLVDDEIDTLESLKDVLEDHGFEVSTLESGTEAVEYVKDNIVDVILMDIKMPIMDGVETFREIKETCEVYGTTVILMTAYSVDGLIREAVHEGVYAILRKPLDPNELFSTIRQAKEGALILIIENDKASGESLKDLLVHEGFLVKLVPSGEAAITWAEKNTQDIVLLDLNLPVMNGLETYIKIKEINPNAVTIMMTTDRQDMAEIENEALRQSAYTCLQKPLDPNALIAMIKAFAKKSVKDAR